LQHYQDDCQTAEKRVEKFSGCESPTHQRLLLEVGVETLAEVRSELYSELHVSGRLFVPSKSTRPERSAYFAEAPAIAASSFKYAGDNVPFVFAISSNVG
jgi:hypothetical protein